MGLPEAKAGLPAFCFSPILFRVPTASGRGENSVPREQRTDPVDPFAAVWKAIAWAEELDRNPGLKRAEIARREGVSRARVTQLLQLAAKGRSFWGEIESSGKNFSIRDLLKHARLAR